MIQLPDAVSNQQMKRHNNHLIIFLKYPQIGKVKTRLAKDIGDKKALDIYKLLVTNTLNKVHSTNFDISIYYTPKDKDKEVRKFVNLKDANYYPQTGRDLGARMLNAFSESFAACYKRTIIIGTDCPEFNYNTISDTFDLLNNHDLVLGPATDGGYYLIGLSKINKELFYNIEWSSEKVLKKTLDIANKLNFNYKLLNFRADIDTITDLNSHKYMF